MDCGDTEFLRGPGSRSGLEQNNVAVDGSSSGSGWNEDKKSDFIYYLLL